MFEKLRNLFRKDDDVIRTNQDLREIIGEEPFIEAVPKLPDISDEERFRIQLEAIREVSKRKK